MSDSPPLLARPVNGFRDLIVWQRSFQLVLECDRISQQLHHQSRWVLADQLFRAAISIPANIAEGQGRLSKADNARHLAIARGSLRELETILLIVQGVEACPADALVRAFDYADEVGRMLTVLIRKLGVRILERGEE